VHKLLGFGGYHSSFDELEHHDAEDHQGSAT
jgi:hypothetical protein